MIDPFQAPEPVPSPVRRHLLVACCSACGLAAVLVFIVALFVPVRAQPTISTSYYAGYSNSFGLLSAVGISFAVLLGTLRWARGSRKPLVAMPAGPRLAWRWVGAVILLEAVVLGIAGFYVIHSQLRYINDAGYIVEQASVYRETGRALYSQIEFAYGPLLLLPAVWIGRLLQIGTEPAYFIGFVLSSVVGLLLLAFVLQELPIRPGLRKTALVLIGVGVLVPMLGMNYTLLRFLTPLAVLLYGTRGDQPWRSAVLLCVGQVLVLLISPEIGIALSVGIGLFGVVRAWQERRWPWLVAAGAPVLLLALLLITLGRPYLKMVAAFSRGALNLPIGPYPQILVLLFALVWLVPFGLGRVLDLRTPEAARLLGAYGLSLALMPAALGRCDPLHVFFDGLCLMILSLVAASYASRAAQVGWAVAFTVLVGWMQYEVQYTGAYNTVEVYRSTVLHHLSRPMRDHVYWVAKHFNSLAAGGMITTSGQSDTPDTVQRLDALVGRGTPIATPLEIRLTTERLLKQSHHYSPDYNAFWVDLLNPGTEMRSIHEVNQYHWMLLPTDPPGNDLGVYLANNTWVFQHINMHYRMRNPIPYYPGRLFLANLQAQWREVTPIDGYVLYRKRTDPSPSVAAAQ